MTDKTDQLPNLEGELSRRDLLRHLIAGNAVGYVIAYGLFDRLEFEEHEGPAALGKAVVARCIAVNENVPEREMELGTDISFYPVDDDTSAEKFATDPDDDPDFAASLLALSVEDAKYLIDHTPTLFLEETTD